MTNPSFGETWLGFVAVLVRRGFFQNIRRCQMLQQIGSQLHRSQSNSVVTVQQ
jgi:hypothetical protein